MAKMRGAVEAAFKGVMAGIVLGFLTMVVIGLRSWIREKEEGRAEEQMTIGTLKREYGNVIDSLRNVVRMKERDVERIVEVRYRYRVDTVMEDRIVWRCDTLWRSDTMEVARTGVWAVSNGCTRISGRVEGDGVYVDTVEVNDDLTAVVYRSGCGRRKVDVVVWSDCSSDTVCVSRNVRIIRERRKR